MAGRNKKEVKGSRDLDMSDLFYYIIYQCDIYAWYIALLYILGLLI